MMSANIFEFILVFVALFQLFRNRIELPILVILLLNEFYGITRATYSTLVIGHNFPDVGILLFLLLMLRLYLRKPHSIDQYKPILKPLKRGIKIFFVFLIIAAAVDLVYNGVRVVSIIKVWRGWIYLLLPWFFNRIGKNEVRRLLRYMLYFSIAFSAYALIRFALVDAYVGGGRSRNVLTLSILVFFLLLNDYYRLGDIKKWLCICLFIAHTVAFGGRTIFVVEILSLLYSEFIQNRKVSLSKVAILVFFIAGLLVIMNTDNVLNRRLQNEGDEIANTNFGEQQISSNLTFRLLMTAERATYISQNPQYAIFGMGNIQESELQHQIFFIGLRHMLHRGQDALGNEVTREVQNQLDTNDTAWPLLLIRYGFFGTAIYVFLFYVPFVMLYFINRKRNPLSSAMYMYLLVQLLILSISWTADIAYSFIWIVPIMTCYFLDKPLMIGERFSKRRRGAVRRKRLRSSAKVDAT